MKSEAAAPVVRKEQLRCLGLKRTTLIHKMQKLGISRSSHQPSPGTMRPSAQGRLPEVQ